MNKGEIPKTGGQKEEYSKNDYENQELFDWAKQENMDLRELNKSIYNQRNGKNVENKKEIDDKKLRDFVEYKNNIDNNINKSNKELNQYNSNMKENPNFEVNNLSKNEMVSNKNINLNKIEDYDHDLDELDTENTRYSLNDNNNNKLFKSISDVNNNQQVFSKSSNLNSNKNSIKYEKKDSIERARPINLNCNSKQEESEIRNSFVANLKKDNFNKIFLDKQNSSKEASKLGFLNDTVEPIKINKRIASISNKIINSNFPDLNESEYSKDNDNPFEAKPNTYRDNNINKNFDDNKHNSFIKNNSIDINSIYSSKIYSLNNEKINQNKNINKDNIIEKNSGTIRDNYNINDYNNYGKTNLKEKYNSKPDRSQKDNLSYESSRIQNNENNPKNENSLLIKNNSLYEPNVSSIKSYKNNQILSEQQKTKQEQNNKYEDINSCVHTNAIPDKNINMHSFNHRNSLSNYKLDSNDNNLGITPKPAEDESNFSVNKSVVINDNYKDSLSNYYQKISPEKNAYVDNKEINKYQNNPNSFQQTNQAKNDVFKNNLNNSLFNNNQQLIPAQFKEIPCVLGAGYKFSYDNYVKSANQPKKTTEFIKKFNKKEHKEEDDIEKMLNNLKGSAANNNYNNKKNEIDVKKTKSEILNNNIHNKNTTKLDSYNSPSKLDKDGEEINKKIFAKNLVSDFQKKNELLTKKTIQDMSNQDKIKSFENLQTKMLKNFDLKAYSNLPNFDIPLDYNSPEKKSRLKKYFMETIKSSLYDIKKDDVESAIKKLELILFYFTNMKDK